MNYDRDPAELPRAHLEMHIASVERQLAFLKKNLAARGPTDKVKYAFTGHGGEYTYDKFATACADAVLLLKDPDAGYKVRTIYT